MSGGRLAPLRLAYVEQRPEVIVVVAPDEPPPGSEALIVQPALAGAAQMGTTGRAGCRIVVRASLPGIGGRYLVQVARSAAAGGWAAEELAALVVELERRCSYLLLASTVAPVVSSGPRRSGVQGPRRAVAWDGGGWSGARTRDLAASARTVSGRGYLCAAAASGSAPPRTVASTLADLTASGVPVGRITHGVAAALGASWAVELLGAPPLSAAQLQRLREQFGAAPRCDWCGLPVVGATAADAARGGTHEPAPPPQRGVRDAGARAGAGGVVRVRRLRPPLDPSRCSGSCRCAARWHQGSGSRQQIWPRERYRSPGRTRTSWPIPASRWGRSQPWRCRRVLR